MGDRTWEEELLITAIEAAKLSGWSLRKIAKFYGSPITHADIQRILCGVIPVSVEKRKVLGLSVQKLAPACSSCGKVHAYDRACEMQVIIKEKPKPKKPKRIGRYPRYYAWMFEQLTKGKDWR